MLVHSQDDGVMNQNGVSVNVVVPVRNEDTPPLFFLIGNLVFLGNLKRP